MWRWVVAAGSATASFWLPSGWAAILVAPSIGAVVVAGAVCLKRDRSRPRLDSLVDSLLILYALVAVLSLAQSRAGFDPFQVGDPIVELTAIHYIYAGCAALVLATAAERASHGWRRLGFAAVCLTAVAPPIVAYGFVAQDRWAQVGGAALMSLGVWATATLQFREAVVAELDGLTRLLLLVSGLAIWLPMVLAMFWAAGQHWDVPAISVPAMVRLHGMPNALGFVLCGLLARRAQGHPSVR